MESLKETLLKEKEENERQLKLVEMIPDLTVEGDRWGKQFLSSDTTKQKATDVSFIHSCGCCPDSVLYAMPYYIELGNKIHSKPIQIAIGEKNRWGYGEVPWDDWKEKLKDYPECVMKKTKEFFKDNPPVNCEEDE